MTTFLLVRHAVHSLLESTLAGRSLDISLNSEGARQAETVADVLREIRVTRIQSSPRRRALETAVPVSRRLGLPIETQTALDEVNFGTWSGRTFHELRADPLWNQWNAERANVRAPGGGETMREVLARVGNHLHSVAEEHPDEIVVMVTHAEVIRSIVLSDFGFSLSDWQRVNVAPASITRCQISLRRTPPNRSALDH